ncbi:sigma-54 dependent transcriptional regulator [Longimicrobium sp.]|uniref:sigma-54 dependent transcriptional regulator n=1 Tax=Longimicrobium sp. TaxID=2029185 RepID=UPI002C4A504F|nr:sigma-54 dependent transcriptional regulator [Longimicrobium sp.]HSU13409.1 sigma-54 dependent transcriptional regulator [Longimicrobium sp.]
MEGYAQRVLYAEAPGIVGESAAIRQVVTSLEAVARVRRTTLITGPTGTGKEIVARVLHERGQPRTAPFVVVHCGGLPDTLAEDELFGHTRGAFTGARDARGGLVRSAQGGTLFLDEVDSLSPKVQASLLRFLESGEFRSVGSDRTEQVRAWVIAASNRDLAESVRRGEFRADLLYRLEVMRIALPPLRLRGGDIELLAHHFLFETVGAGHGFTPRALARLQRYEWPGNVRELKHCIERSALMAEKAVLDAEDLGIPDDGGAPAPVPASREMTDDLWDLVATKGLSLAEAVEHCERAIIDAALRAEEGNRTRAAERLNIHVRTIFKKLQRA